ncbi:MAG: NitT/TauT family transport system substrate-binding protein [Thermoleophilaceae bacterium]|jgi:NitT/TauT family transport system substrate-binding protein|nr:NitT/TauT family transport system substrate-binding protein [Thermoleophilaceae bacterium]
MPRGIALLLALAAGLWLAGCGGDDGGGDGERSRVRVSDTAGVPSAFLEYGVREGFFDRQNLDVEVQPSQGGATVVPAVISGDVDIGGSNLVSVLLAQSKDVPVKIVAPGTSVRSDPRRDFSAIVVAGDSGIRSPEDLEGKTLAVNTLKNVAEVTAKASLQARGVDVSKIELTEVDFPDMTAAIEQGRVDAVFAIEPFVTQAVAGGGRIVDRPYVGTKPGLQIGCYFTSERYLGENGDVVERFRKGLADTAKAVADDPVAFRRFLPEASEIPPEAAEKAVLPEWKARTDPASVDLTAELMERYGVTPEKPDTSDALAE